jgi:hypothetical protein
VFDFDILLLYSQKTFLLLFEKKLEFFNFVGVLLLFDLVAGEFFQLRIFFLNLGFKVFELKFICFFKLLSSLNLILVDGLKVKKT